MELVAHLIMTVLGGFGMAVFIVEKRRDYPARIVRVYLKHYLAKVHRRMPKMLNCTVCTSFWTTLVAEFFLALGNLATGHLPHFWTWPLSGFITLGLTWVTMDYLVSFGMIADASQSTTQKE